MQCFILSSKKATVRPKKLILCLASPARVNQNCAHFLFISFNLRICLLFLIFFVNYDQYLAHTFTSLTPLDRFNVYRTLSTCLEQYYEQSRFILGDIRKKLNERQCACGRMIKKLDWHVWDFASWVLMVTKTKKS